MPDLPTGTVTFLFIDIEGSTRLLRRLGDRYAEVLADYRQLLRTAVRTRGGTEVDTQGDAFLFAFSRARDAVAAAVASQRAIAAHPWPEGDHLRARMGLHTGEPTSVDGGYAGMDVHQAARICAAGHGGQILLSDTTHALVARDLPDGVRLRDLGEHRLKDLANARRLFQVVATGLPSEFSPLESREVPNNLPIQLTNFIGRGREIVEVKAVLPSTRLLTLTGAGGVGKTRLALQVAAEVLDNFPDGVWVVGLASLADPTLVPQAVASVLSVPEHPGRPLTDTLADALRHKAPLMVLDNCEHLQSACAHLIDGLLRGCQHLRILATSRGALGVPGETLWRVPSLSLPDPERLPAADHLAQYEAVRLFVERARAGQPRFALTAGNAPAVVQVCQKLGGIPLAIELAAARTKVLTVGQIAARLTDRFQLLTESSLSVLPRHQTLRATMDWSYDLLSEEERALLRRLSVFAGGCTLEAVEAICAGGGLDAAEILDLLTQLVDKSLVQVEIHDGEARYPVLETVREYGRGRLEEAGETAQVRKRHRDWYLALAERAEPELHGANQIAWLERLEENHDNLRTALEWSRIEAGGDASGLRLAAALCDFWDVHGHVAEGRAWLDEMLSLYKGTASVLRVKALNSLGLLAHRQGDYAQVPAWCGEALTLSRVAGDTQGHAEALHFLAHAAEGAGDHGRAADLLQRSVALHRAAGRTWQLARSLNCLANTARARTNYPKAADLYEEALTIARGLGVKHGGHQTLHNLGYVMLRQRDHQRSRALFREGLTGAEELGDRRIVIKCLGGLAAASAEAKSAWAARLFGAAAALMSAASIRLEPFNRPDFDHYVAVAKSRLGERAFNAAWTQGAAMTLEQAMAYALVTADAAPPVGTTITRLSPREREVASLIARGLTNRAIALRLVIAERTVDAHVEHILNKLGFTSRTQIAAWAVEHGLYKSPSD